MTVKILIIDDEGQIRRMLRIALKSEGFDVIEAKDGESGLAILAQQPINLVVLDLGLPDIDGHQVLERLRDWSMVPVIILSVRNSDREKVTALDNGAQDFVTKPFSVAEFLARIRANLRDRSPQEPPIKLDDGHLLIDLTRRIVTIDGVRVELTPKEFAVLSSLASSPNCVVTQTHLLQEIWGPVHKANTHYLRIVVSHLRQKLGEDPAAPRYIRTEAGVGYRLLFTQS